MIIKRDFTFEKDQLISYYENLKLFVGKKCTQTELADFFKKKYPTDDYYNALDRKFATLKFYGFVYFNDKGELMFNKNYKEYVNALKYKNEDVASSFLKILLSSKDKYYNNSKTNFFELLIKLLRDESILYLDHIDVISFLQHYNLVNDFNEIVKLIKSNRTSNFSDKTEALESFYERHKLDKIAVRVHDAQYLFTFLENNGFYIHKNSLQSKIYLQGKSPRKLEDKRLYISEKLLGYINGYEYEAIADEIEYNSEQENDVYDEPEKDIAKLIEPSSETEKKVVKRYKTDRKLRNNALEKSGYVCEMAKMKGTEHKTFPSRRYTGDYAEVHHLIPMHAQENDLFVKEDKLISLDQLANLIVLCPNCHTKLHYGKNEDVKPELESLFDDRKSALYKNELFVDKEKLLEFYNI